LRGGERGAQKKGTEKRRSSFWDKRERGGFAFVLYKKGEKTKTGTKGRSL